MDALFRQNRPRILLWAIERTHFYKFKMCFPVRNTALFPGNN